jgi:hypothetical protein
MAHQAGPLRLKGKLGDLSFYHNRQHGYLVRQKGGPSKEQVASSDQFARTRENASEFSLAAGAGKLIRQAVRVSTGLTGDWNVSQRLTGILIRMGKSDLSAIRGMRNPARVLDEPASRALLRSFAFYVTRPLNVAYTGPIHCDLAAGSIVLTTDTSGNFDSAQSPFVLTSGEFFHAPKAATHVQIKAAIITLDFDIKRYRVYQTPMYTASLENPMPRAEFACTIDTTDTDARIGVVAIQFLQEKNGDLYALEDGLSLGVVG